MNRCSGAAEGGMNFAFKGGDESPHSMSNRSLSRREIALRTSSQKRLNPTAGAGLLYPFFRDR